MDKYSNKESEDGLNYCGSGLDLLSQSLQESGLGNLVELEITGDCGETGGNGQGCGAGGTQGQAGEGRAKGQVVGDENNGGMPPPAMASAVGACQLAKELDTNSRAAPVLVRADGSRGGHTALPAGISSAGLPFEVSQTPANVPFDQYLPTALYLAQQQQQTMSPSQMLQQAAHSLQQQHLTTAVTMALTGGGQQIFLPHGAVSLQALTAMAAPASLTAAASALHQPTFALSYLTYPSSGSGAATIHRFPAAAFTAASVVSPLQLVSHFSGAPSPKPVQQRRNIMPAFAVVSPDGSSRSVSGCIAPAASPIAAMGQMTSRMLPSAAAAGIRHSPQACTLIASLQPTPSAVLEIPRCTAAAFPATSPVPASAIAVATAGALPQLTECCPPTAHQPSLARAVPLSPIAFFPIAMNHSAVPQSVLPPPAACLADGLPHCVNPSPAVVQSAFPQSAVPPPACPAGGLHHCPSDVAHSTPSTLPPALFPPSSLPSAGLQSSPALSLSQSVCAIPRTALASSVAALAVPSTSLQQVIDTAASDLTLNAAFEQTVTPAATPALSELSAASHNAAGSAVPTYDLPQRATQPHQALFHQVADTVSCLAPVGAVKLSDSSTIGSAAADVTLVASARVPAALWENGTKNVCDDFHTPRAQEEPIKEANPCHVPDSHAVSNGDVPCQLSLHGHVADGVSSGFAIACLPSSQTASDRAGSATTVVPSNLPILPLPPRSVIDMRLYKEKLCAATRDRSKVISLAVGTGAVDVSNKLPAVDAPPTAVLQQASRGLLPEGAPGENEEAPDFSWYDYLKETNSQAAPFSAFKHVELSLQSGFVRGMKVEVALHNEGDNYWLASVVKAYGPLLRLRYEGCEEDDSADFLVDGQSGSVQYIGWCSKNNKALLPPDAIRHKKKNWREFLVSALQGAHTIPAYLLNKENGHTTVDRVRPGMRMEVQHALQPTAVWICQILENVGGRLLLRYDGTESASHDFWLFYLHPRLHPIGWAKPHNCIYKPPDEIKGEHSNYASWNEILQHAIKEADKVRVPAEVFQHQLNVRQHQFQKGWRLEAIDPENTSHIRPATVVDVINCFYFIVQLDEWSSPTATAGHTSKAARLCCHSQSKEIMPSRWCLHHGVKLTPPIGWPKTEFSWDDYLQTIHAQAAPDSVFDLIPPVHGFKRGMKLEAVNPQQRQQVCAATITKIVNRLMWIHLDSSPKMVANHIVDVDSFDLYPVGWCESNSYMLKPPRRLTSTTVSGQPAALSSSLPIGRPLSQRRAAAYGSSHIEDLGGSMLDACPSSAGADGEGCGQLCPKVYINHKCFSGPLLSKGRVAELPRSVGPGRIVVILREVLSMLVNVAYKSSRVLRELQLEGDPNPNMHQQVLKAKYKGKSYRALVELCKDAAQLDDFCRQVCIRLECCPNLVSPTPIMGVCPESCHDLTKTKYTDYYGKKKQRKVGRPPGGQSNLENGAKRGRKKKKKRAQMPQRYRDANMMLDYGVSSPARKDGSSNCTTSATPSPVNGCGDADRRKRLAFTAAAPAGGATAAVLPPSANSSSSMREALLAGWATAATQQLQCGVAASESGTPSALAFLSGATGFPLVRRKRGRPPKDPLARAAAAYGILLPPQAKVPRLDGSLAASLMSSAALSPFFAMSGTMQVSSGQAACQQLSALAPTRVQQYVRPEEKVQLDSNPLYWSVERLQDFLLTTDCAALTRKLQDNLIDGQAFLMLNLPTVQEYLELKLGPAIKLCHHIERLKLAFFEAAAHDTLPPPPLPVLHS